MDCKTVVFSFPNWKVQSAVNAILVHEACESKLAPELLFCMFVLYDCLVV